MAGAIARGAPGGPPPGRTRARVGAVLAPAAFVLLWALPLPLALRPHRLLAIFVAVLVAWVTEVVPIPVTALLIAPAMVAAGVTGAKAAFASYADPLLYLFVGGFFIARAMTRHGLDRRIAFALVSLPGVRGVPARARGMLMVAGLVLSMWISNTASTAILMPILLGVLGVRMEESGDRGPADDGTVRGKARAKVATTSLLAVAYACSLGGLGTMVGSPPNAIAVRFLQKSGVDFGFVDWMKVGVPASLLLLAMVVVVFRGTFVAGAADDGHEGGIGLEAPRGPLSRGEKVTALAFGLAVVGWVVPGILKAAGAPGAVAIGKALPSGGVALIAASVLFLVRDEGGEARVLPWSDATKNRLGDHPALRRGHRARDPDVRDGPRGGPRKGLRGGHGRARAVDPDGGCNGLHDLLHRGVLEHGDRQHGDAAGHRGRDRLGLPTAPPALAVALAASCAFMLPIATGPNAIVYGTGRVPLFAMMRAGMVLNLIGAVLIFVLLRILCPLYGWC